MPITPIYQELSPIPLELEKIFLDPNNPRFTESTWTYISDENIDDDDVQEAARRRLAKYFDVEKLRMNMEVNGYLPIDRVIVRQFAKDKYVVLEGNRRICAAKMISSVASDGSQVHEDVLASLAVIPCLLYTGTESNAAWIFQGLRHISGVVEWSSFNKAKLLVEQMEEESLSLTEVGKRFGLTSYGAGQWVRGYRAFTQAKEYSDYINEIDEKAYPYFQELFSRSSSPIREWMDWNDNSNQFENLLNLNEFVGWLYPRADDDEGRSRRGDFDKRRLGRRDDIRTLSTLISKAPEFFAQFRSGSDIEKVYSLALAKDLEEEAKKKADPVAEVFVAINACNKALIDLPFRAMKDEETRKQLFEALKKLSGTIAEIEEA